MKIPMTSARLVAWTVLAAPGIILLAMPASRGELGVHPLGFTLWKWLHRLVYFAALALFYHQSTAGKGNWGLALFIPVATLQALRVGKVVVIPAFSRFLAAGQFCLPIFNTVTLVGSGAVLTRMNSILHGLTKSRVYRRPKNDPPVVLIRHRFAITCLLF